MDKLTLDRISSLHPLHRCEVEVLINQANSVTGKAITIRIVQGFRTFKEQNGLYALGRTVVNPDGKKASKPKGNIVTNARGGQSYHNYGLAFDFAFLVKDKGEISWDSSKDWDGDMIADWLEVVQIFVKAGYEWGGNWKKIVDIPHIQKSHGLSVKELRAKYDKGDFIKGTTYLNL